MLNKNLKIILSVIILIAAVYFAVCCYVQHFEQSRVVIQGGIKKGNIGDNCKNNDQCKSGYCYGKKGINKTCQDKPA